MPIKGKLSDPKAVKKFEASEKKLDKAMAAAKVQAKKTDTAYKKTMSGLIKIQKNLEKSK